MTSWDLRLLNDKNEILEQSVLFKEAFPNRSNLFFNDLLSKVDCDRSNLIILEVDSNLTVGAVVLYKIDGYGIECWAPSYFFVQDEYRSLSIAFLIKAQKVICKQILNVTPSDSMCTILEAMRYKNHTHGSKILFNVKDCFLFRNRAGTQTNTICHLDQKHYDVDPQFFERKDLTWISSLANNTNHLLCFKKTSWFGFPLQILVFSSGVDKQEFNEFLTKINKRTLGCSLIVYPRFNKSSFKWNLVSKKFRVYGNFNSVHKLYSILGSEITEIL